MSGFSLYLSLSWPPAVLFEFAVSDSAAAEEPASLSDVSDVVIEVTETDGTFVNRRMGFVPTRRKRELPE